MKKIALVVVLMAAVVCFCSAAGAQESSGLKGKTGFGYTNAGTPLGLKMWVSDGMALDASVGFNTAAGVQNFGIQLGADFVMSNKYPVVLQFRPALGFDVGATTNLSVPIMLNIEYFVTKNLSLSAGSGALIFWQLSPASAFTFSHCVNTTSSLGVIYYF